MNVSKWGMISLLLVAVMFSAVGVIYSKYQSRKLFSELQDLRQQRDEFMVAWDRMQLEEGTFATHSRVETLARDRLKMEVPSNRERIYVK